MIWSCGWRHDRPGMLSDRRLGWFLCQLHCRIIIGIDHLKLTYANKCHLTPRNDIIRITLICISTLTQQREMLHRCRVVMKPTVVTCWCCVV